MTSFLSSAPEHDTLSSVSSASLDPFSQATVDLHANASQTLYHPVLAPTLGSVFLDTSNAFFHSTPLTLSAELGHDFLQQPSDFSSIEVPLTSINRQGNQQSNSPHNHTDHPTAPMMVVSDAASLDSFFSEPSAQPSSFLSSQSPAMTSLDTSSMPRVATPEAKPASAAPAEAKKKSYSKKPDSSKSENYVKLMALKAKVEHIQVSLVMPHLSAEPNQDRDRSKWKVPGVGNISVSGQQWFNLNLDKGGNGPINLVMHALSYSFSQAVYWLGDEFGEKVDHDDIKTTQAELNTPKEKKVFDPPLRNDKFLPFIKHYLHHVRAVPMELIDDLIAQNRIYADDAKTCVFIENGIAELRSAFDDSPAGGPMVLKKLATGSTRDAGFLVKADAEHNACCIAVCESAIDAMSFRTLNPGHSVFSSAGAVREFPRKIAEDAVANGYGFVAGFDADEAGDKASQNIFNHFYVKLWVQHRLSTELGVKLDDDALFDLMKKGTVDFNLLDSEAHPNCNLLFFNALNPFENPDFAPTILLTIKKNTLGLPECLDYEMPVSPKAYEYITETLNIKRWRPSIGKDWNEALKVQRATAKPASPSMR